MGKSAVVRSEGLHAVRKEPLTMLTCLIFMDWKTSVLSFGKGVMCLVDSYRTSRKQD